MNYLHDELFVHVGFIGRVHGLDGTMVMQCDFPIKRNEIQVLFIEINGLKVPYKVNDITRYKDDKVFLKLKNVDNKNNTCSILMNNVFLYDVDVNTITDFPEYIHSIIGYSVIDDKKNFTGTISNIEKHLSQYFIQIRTLDGNEKCLHYTSAFVTDINDAEKRVVVKIPHEHINIY